jgi:hypothetical protein
MHPEAFFKPRVPVVEEHPEKVGMQKAAYILECCGWQGAGPNPARIIRERIPK